MTFVRSGGRRTVGPLISTVALLLASPSFGMASGPLAGQFQVNTVTGSAQQRPAAAFDGAGNFVVVWESYSSGGSDTSSRSIQARRFDATGSPVGAEFQVNTSTTGDQRSPAVAMGPGGAFVVVWVSNHQASDDNIIAQRFSAAGAKVGPELLVNSAFTAGVQAVPRVAMADNGDFVVVWRSAGGAGSDPGVSIQGRRWRASSTSFFDQFLVNDTTSGDQDEPAIATDGNTTYLMAWRHPASSNDIAIRYFTADDLVAAGMTADAPQQTANTYPTGSQTAPAVAMGGDGRAVVAWESFGATFGSDTSRISIQARRLDADGVFLDGNDVQINTYTNDDQRFASVTVSSDGYYAVAWQSYGSSGNDASDYSIQLRAFNAEGTALDPSDVQVNTYTTSAQQYPAAALAPTGRMLVAWESNGSPGSDNNGYSVQGRLFQVFTPPSKAVAIPAVARLQGNGAFFTSRIDLYHSGTTTRQVGVTYTPRVDIGGPTRTATVSLPADTLLEITDPLAAWFGFTGDDAAVGSLLLDWSDGNGKAAGDDTLLAQSVVFARTDDGSEFGQFFPALREADALAAGQVGYLATTVDAEVYRVNVGLMGLVDGTQVTVTPQDPKGTALATGKTYNLDRGDNRQLNNIFKTFKLTPRDNILVAVSVASGKALAFASVLDGNQTYTGTSDPTTILPVTGGAQEVTLLELGPIQGINEFSGSAAITNFSPGQATVRARFYLRDTPGVAATKTFNIPAGKTLGYADIVGDLLGLEGVGTLRLNTQNGTLISATGREFAVYRDQGTIVGTAGQLIPGMLPGELLQTGVTYHLLGLRDVKNPAGRERSHISAFNPGTATVTLTLKLYDGATGAFEGETTLTARGGELIRGNSIIPAINSGQNGQVKQLEVTATGPIYVRAFRVNRDGDPITIPPQREN